MGGRASKLRGLFSVALTLTSHSLAPVGRTSLIQASLAWSAECQSHGGTPATLPRLTMVSVIVVSSSGCRWKEGAVGGDDSTLLPSAWG
ncbi:hypothetical protein PR003_g5100 [Phytophthora rubi]|uniref:Secreted protein n=1 Tax=Phytophthora rubi TaxID=129364 RepID=A0A6A3NWC4_9STRA|nr:hypothetical protein PR001_g4956 [Phytophthora rubi]KAE9350967.1 hypothetical protein PR003_g5100 [Phytophthora rubi]